MKSLLNPKFRVLFFLLVVNVAVVLFAKTNLDRVHWLWLAPIALSINLLLLTYDQVLRFSNLACEPLLGNDPWGLLKLVHVLAEKHHLPTPKVFRIPQPYAQVFCYARSRSQGRIYITEGVLDLLSRQELEAVISYQLTVIEYSYSVLNYWVAAFIDIFFRMGQTLEKLVSVIFGWSPPLAAWLVTPCLWLMRVVLLSSTDFRKLDSRSLLKIPHPEALASALYKMESYAQNKPWRDAWIFSHMCMVSPLPLNSWYAPLRVQPHLKSRIKALIGRYPL